MQTISEDVVEHTWQRMAQMPEEDVPKLVEAMQAEQPELLVFLLAAGEDLFTQAEQELQLYLGMVVWQIMRQGNPRPQRITEDRLERFIDRTDKMAEYLMGESEGDFVASSVKIFKNHNQINVLRYVVEALFEDEEFEDESEDDDMTEDFLAGKEDEEEEEDWEEEDEPDEADVREEIKGLIFLNLKSEIEALDQ